MSLPLKLLLTLTCFSIVGAFWVFGQVERENYCLKSEFFHSISWKKSITNSSEIIQYPICKKIHRNESTRVHLKALSEFRTNLERFENVVLISRKHPQPFILEVVEQPKLYFKVTMEKVIIGRELFYSKGHLLKAWNMAWLLQMNQTLSQRPVLLESLSDFLVAVQSGGLEIRQPLQEKEDGENRVSLPTNVRAASVNLLSICQNEWLPPSKVAFCGSFFKLTDEQRNKVDVESLKGLFSTFEKRSATTHALWEQYLKISFTHRITALTRFFSWIESEDFNSFKFSKKVGDDVRNLFRGNKNVAH